MSERKEWVKVSHSPGRTTVSVTLQEGNCSVRWGVKSYPGQIKASVAEARSGAETALAELQEALSE